MRFLALVHHREHVKVPNGGPVVIVGVVEGDRGEDTRLSKLSKHDLVQVVTSEHTSLKEVSVGSFKHVSQTNVDPAVLSIHISQLILEEVEGGCIVVESSLDEKSLGQPSEPVLVKLGIGGVLPEGDHSVGSCGLLSNLVVGEQGRVDGATRDA